MLFIRNFNEANSGFCFVFVCEKLLKKKFFLECFEIQEILIEFL